MRRIQSVSRVLVDSAVVSCLTLVFGLTSVSADPDSSLERRRGPIVSPPVSHGGLEASVPGTAGDVVPIDLPEPSRRRDRVPPQHDATAGASEDGAGWWQRLLAWARAVS